MIAVFVNVMGATRERGARLCRGKSHILSPNFFLSLSLMDNLHLKVELYTALMEVVNWRINHCGYGEYFCCCWVDIL